MSLHFILFVSALARAAGVVEPSLCPATPPCSGPRSFPEPDVVPRVAAKTREQVWMDTHYPGYMNGVSFGGLFVIEDWMFWRKGWDHGFNDTTLRLKPGESFSEHAWSAALLSTGENASSSEYAFAAMACHIDSYIDDSAISRLADFGINAVRLPVGYWVFDDPDLYPNDAWVVPPRDAASYGVNPDGYVTPGTRALSNIVMKLHNANMRVVLDLHAVPGCSSPHNSYAGIKCEPSAPNTWGGKAEDGISGGHSTNRARDGKTWIDVYKRLVVERVLPWIAWINDASRAPGTIVGFEMINEPDINYADASDDQVRCLTLDMGRDAVQCMGRSLAQQVRVIVSNGAQNYKGPEIARDFESSKYAPLRDNYVADVHNYFNWGGCTDNNRIEMDCVCHCGIPGKRNDDGTWDAYTKSGMFDRGWQAFVGEWSSAINPAHSCNGGLPTHEQAHALWLAQKWGYASVYAAYRGRAANGTASSFIGDFYWTARMGYNWNVDPSVCAGNTSVTNYTQFPFWDWSLIRLIELGLAQPLSQLGGAGGLTPDRLAGFETTACSGSFKVNC